MAAQRYLVVIADDFGMGPATSRGILDVAAKGLLSGTVLLVNSPHAAEAVRLWRQTGIGLELGWHPCLTLDAPILPAEEVASLVGKDGRLHPLGEFLRRACLGQLRAAEVEAELRAQFNRFRELVGQEPTLVNSHQHVSLFAPVGEILLELLRGRGQRPYVRRVRESWRLLLQVPGARLKRTALSLLGHRDARRQEQLGFPGNDWLAGITDPPCVADTEFFARWLARVPGDVVELVCHPGHLDPTLIGRDCPVADARLQRRVHEYELLQQANFRHACQRAGFRMISPSELCSVHGWRPRHAA